MDPELDDWIEKQSAAADLAAVLSIASTVEPALLRSGRLALRLEVLAEAELWFSPLVETRSPAGLKFTPAALDLLRPRLLRSPHLQLARELTFQSRRQASLPAAARLQEELAWSSLSPSEAVDPSRLDAVVLAIVNEGRTTLANWARSALPRLPPEIRTSLPARRLAQAAASSGMPPVAGFEDVGAPPAWMNQKMQASASSPDLQTSIRFYTNRIEFRTPPRTDETMLYLPDRFWLTWYGNNQRRIAEVRLSKRGLAVFSITGSEVRIDTAWSGAYLIRDKRLDGASRHIYLCPASSEEFPLAEYLQNELMTRSHTVFWPDRAANLSPNQPITQREREASQTDFFLYIARNHDSDWVPPEFSAARRNCRNILILRAPGGGIWNEWERPGETVLDFQEEEKHDVVLAQLLDIIQQPIRKPGELDQVPLLPDPYIEPAVFSVVKERVLAPGQTPVQVVGPAGAGKTVLGSALARDCDVRRRFPQGIYWNPASPRPSGDALVIIDGVYNQRADVKVLSLNRYGEKDEIQLNWSQSQLVDLFRKFTGAEEASGDMLRLWHGSPALVVATGEWWRAYNTRPELRWLFFDALVQSGVERAGFLLANLYHYVAATQALYEQNAPVSVIRRCLPPDGNLTDGQIELLQEFLRDIKLPEYEFGLDALLNANKRLVASYEQECGGDWILGPRDGYFDEHIEQHLQAVGRQQEMFELMSDLDWIERQGSLRSARDASPGPKLTMLRRARELLLEGHPQTAIAVLMSTKPETVEEWAGRWVGRLLARNGYALITEAFNLVFESYGEELSRLGASAASLLEIDGYILLGSAELSAVLADLPAFPIPATGTGAAQAWQRLALSTKDPAIAAPIDSPISAGHVVRALMRTLLESVPPVKPSRSFAA